MRNYVKPSIELNKFDVEDIITVSGIIKTADELTPEAAAIYDNPDNFSNDSDEDDDDSHSDSDDDSEYYSDYDTDGIEQGLFADI